MEELALARVSETQETDADSGVAEVVFNRKKMLQLEQGISMLQKTTRQHNEVVASLEGGIKAMISETDLRRAIGLAFQEFELRLHDAFTDSNRKCLAMFSTREDVQELQSAISKKVNWSDWQVLMKKMGDLRQYLDTMAESVFVGHRQALNGEFAKKADREVVETALAKKADVDDLNTVRARLERLEEALSFAEARNARNLGLLDEELAKRHSDFSNMFMISITDCRKVMDKCKSDQASIGESQSRLQEQMQSVSERCDEVREAQHNLHRKHDSVMMPALSSLEVQHESFGQSVKQLQVDLKAMNSEMSGFQDVVQTSLNKLSQQVQANVQHAEFLLQETDMIKRRSKESGKKQVASLQDISDKQVKLSQQVETMERDVRKTHREVRAIESRTAKAIEGPLTARTPRGLPALGPAASPAGPDANPSDNLKQILHQLGQLANGGPVHEQLGVQWNPERPPLPTAAPIGAGHDDGRSGKGMRFCASDPAPIDLAGGGMAAYSATARSMRNPKPRS